MQKRFRGALLCPLLAALLLLAIGWGLGIGSVSLPPEEIYAALLSPAPDPALRRSAAHDIVWLLRLPRLLLAAAVGCGLSVAGVVMQAIVKNPLADPYLLGVSSGASLGATAAVLLGLGRWLGENCIGLAAFAGALAVSLGVLFLAGVGGRPNAMKLLLGGMALSAVCSAFSSFIVYFAGNMEGIQTIAYWMMGSFAEARWSQLAVIAPIVLAAAAFFWTQSRALDLMLLGDETAVTLGADLHTRRSAYLLVCALVVGFTVYAAGMIGFVGLIVPHVVRMLVGTGHRMLLPVGALAGAVLLVAADGLCRVLIPRTELPIGVLVSLIGAPCFVYLMMKRSFGFGGN